MVDIIGNLTSAAKILREADKIEQYNQILQAQETLLNYQRKIGELEEEVKKLKDIKGFKDNAEFRNNCYWLRGENSNDGPFCSKCLDSDNLILRLHIRRSDGFATCPHCKNHVWSRGEISQFRNHGSSFSNPVM